MELQFIPRTVFEKVNKSKLKKSYKLPLIAKMCRLNTFMAIKKAGSGHIGSSMSAMDIVVYLFYYYLNTKKLGIRNLNRDIYFSSKGHDAPGLYSVLYSLGIIPEKRFLKLRRIDGLDGHPNLDTPGIEANTGSLGMGISKARGMIFAKKLMKRKGKVIVLTGDGEFQEGQNYEALQSAVQQKITDLTVIIDHNKIQSDSLIKNIIDLGKLEKKFNAFGWYVIRCNGHMFASIEKTIKKAEKIRSKPKIIICDTIKGRGVSFMEHPRALKIDKGLYRWHSGAPDDRTYERAYNEILTSIKKDFEKYKLGSLELKTTPIQLKKIASQTEIVADGYEKALMEIARKNKRFVILDADLAGDCRVKKFSARYPNRFVECGIAEQDMVSMAGGIALQGLTPIVNSFACFLSSRANEQIYNNHTEGKKVIYMCHYAGIIPAGPGKSHQSVRDISLFGALPNCTILQASNPREMEMITDYAINQSKESCMVRINIGPSPCLISLPKNYHLRYGQGIPLTDAEDFVMFAYGPTMIHEALVAHEELKKEGVGLKVVNMPWLNRFDKDWLKEKLSGCKHLFILEDHSSFGGLGDNLIDFINRNHLLCKFKITKFAIDEFPAYGTADEVLRYHRLDGVSLAKQIASFR